MHCKLIHRYFLHKSKKSVRARCCKKLLHCKLCNPLLFIKFHR